MINQTKDREILKHIDSYCKEIQTLVIRFGDNKDLFKKDSAYKHSCTMCIFQIGELAKHLSDEFCKKS